MNSLKNKWRDVIFKESDCKLIEKRLISLFETVSNNDVCVISVLSDSNNANNLITEIIIKLLTQSFNGELIDVRDNSEVVESNYDSKTDEQKTSLVSEGCSEPSITTIVRISKPIQITLNNGNQIVVIVIDSDFKQTDIIIKNKFWFAVRGLCLSLSSCHILNITDNFVDRSVSPIDTEILLANYFLNNLNGKTHKNESKTFQSLLYIRQENEEEMFETQENNIKALENNKEFCWQIYDDICVRLRQKESEISPDSDKENNKEFERLLSSFLNSEHFSEKLSKSRQLLGKECCDYVRSYIDLINQNIFNADFNDKILKDDDLISFSQIKETYNNKIMDFTESNPSFVKRRLLAEQHNSLMIEMLNNLLINDTLNKANAFTEIIFNCIDVLTLEYSDVYSKNEEKRSDYFAQKMDKSCEIFVQHLKSSESSDCDQLLKEAEIKAYAYFEHNEELYESDCEKLSNRLESEKMLFETRAVESLAENKNSAAVLLAISHYETAIVKQFEKIQSIDKDELIKRRIDIEKEASNIFVRECVYGSETDRERFKHNFAQKLYEMNAKFKQKIDENEKQVLEYTLNLIKTSVTHYDNLMKQYLEITLEEKWLKNVHEITLKGSVNMFTENCINKENRFIETYRNDLKAKLEIRFNEILAKLRENIEVIEKQYAKEVRKATERYTKDIEKVMFDNQFIDDNEFSKIGKQVSDRLTNEFESKEWQKTEKFSFYVTELSKILSEEYIRLFGINAKTREISHNAAVKYCRVVSEKYEDVMYEEIKKISENEFEELHEKHKQSAINELKNLNPFKCEKLIDSYLLQLEINIEKSVVDLKELLSEHIARTNAENEILVRDVNVFYKQEMNKYYLNTCYLSQDRLKSLHLKTFEHSLSEFASRRQQNCSVQQFRSIIESTIENAFLAILEENSKNTPTIPAIGIDLGTTNTAVAYYKPGTPFGKEIILQNDGENTTPSVVAFTSDSDLVGNSAKEHMFYDPRNTVYSIKRLIGRNFSDDSVQNDMKNLAYRISVDKNNRPLINVNTRNGPKTYSPEELSAKVLSEMKRVAEQHFRIPIINAVITVPAYFTDSQKQATKDAAKIAGLNVLEIMPEPIAAALAFKLKNTDKEKRNVLVYDLGGGTFDVAVLVIEGLNIELKSLNGDNHLGGDDFDINLRAHCMNEFYEKTNMRVIQNSKEGANSFHRLKSECEKKKKLLSSRNSATIVMDNFFNKEDLKIEVTRETFERINSHLFEKTMKLLKDTLVSAYLSPSDIDDVVLVGGSTRIPKIREMLSDIFPNKQLNYTVNADEAVALGAAVQAAVLNGIKAQELGHLKISKIAPMSLGVKVKDGWLSKIIQKNSRIPIKVTEPYYTVYDNQTEAEIIVYEGENEIADKNNELGRFMLRNIPRGKARERPIDIIFDIKDDGILFVKAVLRNSNNSHEINIVRHSGSLTDEELYRLIEQEMNEQK